MGKEIEKLEKGSNDLTPEKKRARNKRILLVILIVSITVLISLTIVFFVNTNAVEATMMFSDFTYGGNSTYQERCIVSVRCEGGDPSFTEKYDYDELILRVNMPSFCRIEMVSMNPSPRPVSKPTIWEEYTYNANWVGGEIDNDSIDYSTIDIRWEKYDQGIYSAELLISWADVSKGYEDYLLDVGPAKRCYVYVLPLERSTWNHNTDIILYGHSLEKHYNMYIDGLGKVEWSPWFDDTLIS